MPLLGEPPGALLSHCTAISFLLGRDACLHLAVGGTRAQREESACSGSHSKRGARPEPAVYPCLGRLVCAQAEDAQRKSGTNKDVHLRC